LPISIYQATPSVLLYTPVQKISRKLDALQQEDPPRFVPSFPQRIDEQGTLNIMVPRQVEPMEHNTVRLITNTDTTDTINPGKSASSNHVPDVRTYLSAHPVSAYHPLYPSTDFISTQGDALERLI
jgi:hypothetical protein